MLGRCFAVVFVMSAVLGGCVARHDTPVAHVAAERSQAAPLVTSATTTAPTTTTTSPPAPAPSRVAAASISRPQVPRTATAPAVHHTAPPAAPTWAHYDGQLTGGNYIVTRAVGGAIDVSPSPDAAPAATLANPLPSGAPRVLLVVQTAGDWLQVLLPLRPNDSLGWVRRADVTLSSVPYRVEIDRAAHRLQVYDGSSIVMDEPVAVGKRSTPTPSGQFFAVELLNTGNPGGAYGPYAFTLSAYSDVYQTFGSGDGAVGMHGTNETSSVGQDASHGCVRLHNDAVTRLANILPLGTPVFIR